MHDFSELSLHMQILLGVITGTLTGLTGASGMSVLVSALLTLKVPAEQVIAATFAVAGGNASFGIMPYLRKHKPSMHEYAILAVPASLGGVASYLFVATEFSGGSLRIFLTVFMLLAGIYLAVSIKGQNRQLLHMPRALAGIMAFLAGGIIGVFGAGGTVIITLVLVILLGIQYHRALMLSLLMTALTCIPLIILSHMKDNLAVKPILVVFLSSIPCALIAGTCANKLPENLIKRLLGLYLIGISVYLLIDKI